MLNISYPKQSLEKREGVAWDLLDVMTEMVILVDRQGVILWANRTASKQLDKSLEIMRKIGKKIDLI